MSDLLCQSAASLGYEPGSLKARIAAAAEVSCAKHQKNMPSLPMGGSAKEWKKANKKRSKALKALVRADVAPQFENEDVPDNETPPRDPAEPDSIDWEQGDPTGFIFAFLTIGWLIEVIVAAVISWWIEHQLEKRLDP